MDTNGAATLRNGQVSAVERVELRPAAQAPEGEELQDPVGPLSAAEIYRAIYAGGVDPEADRQLILRLLRSGKLKNRKLAEPRHNYLLERRQVVDLADIHGGAMARFPRETNCPPGSTKRQRSAKGTSTKRRRSAAPSRSSKRKNTVRKRP